MIFGKMRLKLAALAVAVASPADAALRIDLDGHVASAQVNVALSGEYTSAIAVTGNQYLINVGWGFLPIGYDPFPAAISADGVGIYLFTSGVARFENLTRGWSLGVPGIWLQDSSNSPIVGLERFGFLTSDRFQLNVGDVVQISGNATIDLTQAGLTIGDLMVGSTGELCDIGLCGQLQISAVPEPSVTAMLLLGFGLYGWSLRTRHRRQPRVDA